MVEKLYEWESGAVLEDHSRRKHKILREYFFNYLMVRCQVPQQERFRLAVIDGFSGGGRYSCGSPGSPIIFIEELRHATDTINLKRRMSGMREVQIECLLLLNDSNTDAVELLKSNVEPLLAAIRTEVKNLHISAKYFNERFESIYPKVKEILHQSQYRNVLFSLDQCGHSQVGRATLFDVMRSYRSAEVFYTFSIEALVTYLRASDPLYLQRQLRPFGIEDSDYDVLSSVMNKKRWLGTAERMVFNAFKECAPYVSPFSIHNPDGWRYWFIHFSNFYRARQVYNNILHANSSAQAHFGRSGLNMLSYNPEHENGSLYLFDDIGRRAAEGQLSEDIPRLISAFGDAMSVNDFYENVYNATPAHADDIHAAIINHPDIQVLTPTGGERRKPTAIRVQDTIKLKSQPSFFPMFLRAAEITGSDRDD